MTTKSEAVNAMTTPLITVTAEPAAINAAGPAAAWSRRVRRIGGFIQAAFAAFWLARASLAIGGRTGDILLAASGVAVIGVFGYAIIVTAGTAPRPAGPTDRAVSERGHRHRTGGGLHSARHRHRGRPLRLGAAVHRDHHRAAAPL